MTKAEKNLARILGQVVRKEEINWDTDVKASELLDCALKNSVFHIIYNSVTAADGCKENLSPYMIKEMDFVFEEANQSHAWVEFASAAEEVGIDILMLKGIQVKNYYPVPESRNMCDVDFLYKPHQASALEKLFISLGYEKKKATVYHDGWFNPENGVTFEAHHILNSAEDKEKDYYSRIWNRAANLNGKNHVFQMPAEDLYVYLLLHMRAHFKTESANLRQLTDLYVMQCYSGVREDIVKKYSDELGIGILRESVEKTAAFLFEENSDYSESNDVYELADFVLGNVSFGKYSFTDSKESYKSGGSKFKAFMAMVFPTADRIYKSYPFIATHRFLLPFGYAYRLLQAFGIRRRNTAEKIRILSGISPEAAEQGERTNKFFRKFGI